MTGYFTDRKKSEILDFFVRKCDESKVYYLMLYETGFNLFRIMEAFEGAFGDPELHHKFMIESGKELVGSIDGGLSSLLNGKGYQSPYLKNLQEQRDIKNGMNINEYRKTNPKPWELMLDSSQAARLKLQLENPSDFYKRKSEFDSVFRDEKKVEVNALTPNDLNTVYDESDTDRFSTLVNLMSACLGQFGFSRDETYSSKKYPVFCRGKEGNIVLCCGIKSYDDLLIQPHYGRIELVFHLREKSFNRSKIEASPHTTVKDSEKFLILNLHAIVPYFLSSYSAFESIQEFYLNLKAQTYLFVSIFDDAKDTELITSLKGQE